MHRTYFISPLLFSLFTFIFLLSNMQQVQAQLKRKPAAKHAAANPFKAGIFVKARAINGKIYLRWAVNQPAAWKLANKYGYMVERYTVVINGKLNQQKDRVLLTPTPITPHPEIEWGHIIQQSNDAAIVAQGLFGDSFVVSAGTGLANMVSKSSELQQRFTFSLLAADRNFEAAKLAGWGYVDNTVNKDEKYLYRIYTNVPTDKAKIDTGGTFIGTKDDKPLPKPKDLYATFGDKLVMLSWNYRLLKDYYTSYFIERADRGGTFKRLLNLPVANLNSKGNSTPSKMFYTDTIPLNNRSYAYRVRGITCFGEVSPPSDVVNGEGAELLAYVPSITKSDFLNDSTVTITWEIADQGKRLIDHYELNWSANAKTGTYKTVNKNIPPTLREVSYNKLLAANYFTITAVGMQGSKRTSFPYLVQAADTVPPASPTGLTATIDSSGHVLLKWKANTEPDLFGYTILRSNLKNEEPAVLNKNPQSAISFKEYYG